MNLSDERSLTRQIPTSLFRLCRNGVFEVKDQDAVVVELAVVKAPGFVDRDAQLAGSAWGGSLLVLSRRFTDSSICC